MTAIGQECRSCGAPLHTTFVDLGTTPLANSLLLPEDMEKAETYLPLRAFVCDRCFLVQLQDFVLPESIFRDYLYFSSFSSTWLAHARTYMQMITRRLGLDGNSFVVEVASNDGYLLKEFVAHGIPCLGIEPAENVADAARAANVPTKSVFFGKETAAEIENQYGRADLIIANNVLAHVQNLNDFIGGFAALLSANGVLTIEAPHFLKLLQNVQFDTIYHEHYSYLSLLSLEHALARHGLEVFDVEELPTHGGSLRYYIHHEKKGSASERLNAVRAQEMRAALNNLQTYSGFQRRVIEIKYALLDFLLEARRQGRSVAGYGAAAKGNTLLNYCGIDSDLISFVVDRNPHKQGRYLPGSRISVLAPNEVTLRRPDFLLILPWNLKSEIMASMAEIREWGAHFVWAVPRLEVST
jgi:2-polyprenyl-3-methyl-5-hydroxy-6-metoxy-1,4-benzoquinol methylase